MQICSLFFRFFDFTQNMLHIRTTIPLFLVLSEMML